MIGHRLVEREAASPKDVEAALAKLDDPNGYETDGARGDATRPSA